MSLRLWFLARHKWRIILEPEWAALTLAVALWWRQRRFSGAADAWKTATGEARGRMKSTKSTAAGYCGRFGRFGQIAGRLLLSSSGVRRWWYSITTPIISKETLRKFGMKGFMATRRVWDCWNLPERRRRR
ncbi:hypothetical protein KCP74_00885 [Salmonella enterica subsp. enterica]|nr:hypothetical protein KCP74_00885 [Salmonella enterica subsp. enterica]